MVTSKVYVFAIVELHPLPLKVASIFPEVLEALLFQITSTLVPPLLMVVCPFVFENVPPVTVQEIVQPEIPGEFPTATKL